MMIVEAIQSPGIIATGPEIAGIRMTRPEPGDIVDFHRMGPNKYPFTHVRHTGCKCDDEPTEKQIQQALNRRGTIDSIGEEGKDGWAGPDEIHVCCEPGSCHLSTYKKRWTLPPMEEGQEPLSQEIDKPYVSISGGPFEVVKKAQLVPTHRMEWKTFWCWGRGGAGAHRGCYFQIERPVFELIPIEEVGAS